ncbi:hypothetical protein HDU67_001093 [Dinochytrium kinnereticum]|nr:hypothetical protein HDU67_001093 [Dinochytrium kinnereticum]
MATSNADRDKAKRDDDLPAVASDFEVEVPPLSYQITRGIFSTALDIFFRDITQRGAHKIPEKGPVIFVCAPHANQFVDPLVLIKHAGRQVGFLAAKKSMDKFWIGLFARSVGSIPVVRPQDLAKAGEGRVYLADPVNNPLILSGEGTKFTEKVHPRSIISCGGATLEVVEVLSDTSLKFKNPVAAPKSLAILTASKDGQKGASYKITPHVDQSQMFSTVIKRLKDGGCVGIFPEGGSHDRSEFLPLKPGVAMMALGAMAEHEGLDVKVVPCGLNYFHADKFRSRGVIEFGDPIDIPAEYVKKYREGGTDRRVAVGSLLDDIFKGLKSVAVTAPDYETLMVLQAARRLYKPIHTKLSLDQTLVLTRRFGEGFNKYRSEPAVQELFVRVQEYNKLLEYYGVRDHQVMKTSFGGVRALLMLLRRFAELLFLFTLAAPGVFMHLPIALVARSISKKKAIEAKRDSSVKLEGRDVIATWKILVALVLTPLCYTFYNLIFFLYLFFFTSYTPRARGWACLFFSIICPSFGWAAVRASEIGFDILKSLRPLFLAILPRSTEPLRLMRTDLTARLNAIIDDLGPGLFGGDRAEFEASRIIRPEDISYSEVLAGRMNKYGRHAGKDILRWEQVDSCEVDDDVFLFRDENSGGVKGTRRSASGTRRRSDAHNLRIIKLQLEHPTRMPPVFQIKQEIARFKVPDFEGFIVGSRNHSPSTELEGTHELGVPSQGVQLGPSVDVPDFNGLIDKKKDKKC